MEGRFGNLAAKHSMHFYVAIMLADVAVNEAKHACNPSSGAHFVGHAFEL
jgi:hypothetical protein